ncbi:MAG TPA: hypothetical protein VH085_08800 [Nocardioides sp.]|jgi:hypothetical protein|nr:hypothetical protein [Nocardioides sp.]
MTSTTRTTPPWRRLAALGIGLLTAAAAAGLAGLNLPVWAAAAGGVVAGHTVAGGLVAWDARYFPDLEMVSEAGVA